MPKAMKFDEWKAKVAVEGPKSEKIPTLRLVKEQEAPKTVEAAEALASQEETTPEEDRAIETGSSLADKIPEVDTMVRESEGRTKKGLKERKGKRNSKIREVLKKEKREEAKEERDLEGAKELQRKIDSLKAEQDELHPDAMAERTIKSLERQLEKLNKKDIEQIEVQTQVEERPEGRISEIRELEPEKTEAETEAPEFKKQEQGRERSGRYLNLAVDEVYTPRGVRYQPSSRKIEGGLRFDAGGAGSIRVEPRLARTLRKAEKPVVVEPETEEKAPESGEREVAKVTPEIPGKEEIPEIKTSPMAETIKLPEAEAEKEEVDAYIKMVTEAALAEPEAVPVKKAKTVKEKPVVAPEAKDKEKPPEPVKSKVETRRAPAKIVFEGETEDLLKGAARSSAEQKKHRLEARLSEIKNSETNEWSDAYADLGGFDQPLWEQLNPEKGNEAKSERERFKELRYNSVDYDLKEVDINNGLRIKRNRIAGYEQRLKDASLNKGDREDLEDELKDIRNSEKASLLELKGIEDLRKKDEAEEAELLGKAQERLATKKAEAEGNVDVDLSEINAAITPENQAVAAEAGKGKKTGGFKRFAKKTGMVAGYGLGIGAAYVIRPAAKGLITAAQWIGWKGQLKLLEGLMNFSKDPGAWFTEKFKKTEGFDFGKWLNERNKKKAEKPSKE